MSIILGDDYCATDQNQKRYIEEKKRKKKKNELYDENLATP